MGMLSRRNGRVVAAIVFNLLLICAMILLPWDAAQVYIKNYVVDAACLMILISMCMYYIIIHGFDIFDPLYLITFVYSFLYYVTPIYDIKLENYAWFGYYKMFPYGVKASLIALAGYIAFYISYTGVIQTKRTAAANISCQKESSATQKAVQNSLVLMILAGYAFSFAANMFYLIHSGYTNVLYILTMGILGSGGESSQEFSSIGFAAMFSYCLPTLTLLYWEYAEKKWVTVILFVPMLMMQVTRGFRFLIVQIAISFITYYFISRGRKPRIRHLLIVLGILMIPVLLMTLFRDDVRSGSGIQLGVITLDTILEAIDDAIWDNFRIYNNFYGIVHAIPQKYGYVYGRQIIIGTLIMAIPRAIWPGKISTSAGEDLYKIVGIRLKGTGQAYPGLGEYYYAFGVLGVVICMALYGNWMRRVRCRYKDNAVKRTDVIMFSVLLGANLQLLIRGYTPGNFWYVVFSLLPIGLINLAENTITERTFQVEENN